MYQNALNTDKSRNSVSESSAVTWTELMLLPSRCSWRSRGRPTNSCCDNDRMWLCDRWSRFSDDRLPNAVAPSSAVHEISLRLRSLQHATHEYIRMQCAGHETKRTGQSLTFCNQSRWKQANDQILIKTPVNLSFDQQKIITVTPEFLQARQQASTKDNYSLAKP